MAKDIEFRFLEFLPATAERISGFNQMQQRNLRRHGYMPKRESGWTRNKLQDVASLTVINNLWERGFPPLVSHKIAARAAIYVVLFALEIPGAVHDPENIAKGEKPIKTAPADAGPRYLVFWGKPGSEHYGFKTEEQLGLWFNSPSDPSYDRSVVIVLDLQLIAQQIVDRAGQPLVKVVYADEGAA